MERIFIATLLLFLLLLWPAAPGASSFTNYFCSPLYNTNTNFIGTGSAVSQSSTYTGILDFSLVIILAVLVVLGIIYAIGYSMRIDKLKNYTKTELLESVFNVIIIVAIAGGMALIDSGVSFITSVANAGVSGAASAISSQTGSNVQFSTTQVSNAHDLYVGICSNYGSEVFGLVGSVIGIYEWSFLNSFLSGFSVNIMPNQGGFVILTPGFSVTPFRGLTVATQVLLTLFNIVTALGLVLIGVPLLLFFIYYLFPFFLYAGVLFRSFPWTRAAGGTLLALFISFYIVFPSILYPFSAISISSLSPAYTAPSLGAGGLNTNNIGNSAGLMDLGGMIDSLVGEISGVALQIGGVLIALIVSYDLIEMFGKLLGAPSVKGSRMLSKMV